MRYVMIFGLLIGMSSVSAFGDVLDPDPVGFCAVPATAPTCSTGTGLVEPGATKPETIGITDPTSFGMFKTGGNPSQNSINPWYLLVSVPNGLGGVPKITSPNFTQKGSTTALTQHLLPTTNPGNSIYDLAGLIGDGSMNSTNMFGLNEQAAFGGTPKFFKIYVYKFTPYFNGKTGYEFDVGGSGLVAGTFLAASGGSNPFSTPFTVTGLVKTVPDGGVTLMLLGGALVGIETLRGRFRV